MPFLRPITMHLNNSMKPFALSSVYYRLFVQKVFKILTTEEKSSIVKNREKLWLSTDSSPDFVNRMCSRQVSYILQ